MHTPNKPEINTSKSVFIYVLFLTDNLSEVKMKQIAIPLVFIVCTFIILTIVFSVGCGKESNPVVNETYNPDINLANFITKIDNKYFPLDPGTTFIYQGKTEDGTEKNEVYVTHKTRTILGVTCIEVEDRVWVNDELTEMTLDWYAQDKDGNVWYFGEDSKEYNKGVVVSTKGSWESGVNGAKPGIIMQANPQVSKSYRQEYYKGEAEDMAEVLGLNESASVPYGSYKNCLKTKDWSPHEPDVIENKYFSQGIGEVLSVTVKGGSDRMELVNIKTE